MRPWVQVRQITYCGSCFIAVNVPSEWQLRFVDESDVKLPFIVVPLSVPVEVLVIVPQFTSPTPGTVTTTLSNTLVVLMFCCTLTVPLMLFAVNVLP